MIANLVDLQLGGWTLKLRIPSGPGPHPVIFLIHGWTGDENSMWVFASRLPKKALLIAPRAPYISKHPEYAGYSWVPQRSEGLSRLPDFGSAVAAFDGLVSELASRHSADFEKISLIGFSQGSAFSIAYALRHQDKVNRLAMLAGFLPEESERFLAELSGLPIFIAHGTRDETVPIALARRAQSQLTEAGARVRYCESATGHKLGANCARELGEFFADV